MLADLQTPVSIYLKVRDQYPQSALLESTDYHGGENSFSFIAFDPVAQFAVRDPIMHLSWPDGLTEERAVAAEVKVPETMSDFVNALKPGIRTKRRSSMDCLATVILRPFNILRIFRCPTVPQKAPEFLIFSTPFTGLS
jgi:anthranilate/para-aminobenzoate synthase component I